MVMREAKIAELKAKLSAFLAAVRKGETVVVYDRATPIARITPYEESDDFSVIEAVDHAREARKLKAIKPLKAVNVDKYLLEARQDK